MNTVFSILIAILMFGLLIFIHELGHFIAAKKSGVKVNEFAIGMGPVVFKFVRGETQYAIRLFPMGGFVAMEGENDSSGDSQAFCNAKLYKRVIITIAGAAMNIALGLVIMFIISASQPHFGTTTIAKFEENAATSQWINIGDEITHVNGHKVKTSNDLMYELSRDRDGLMDIRVIRNGENIELKDVQFRMDDIQGAEIIHRDFWVQGVESTPALVLQQTLNSTTSVVKQVWGSLIDLLTGRFGFAQMTGPIGITQQIGEVTKSGQWGNLLMFMGYITINLGVFNLLPVPALDGGRLLFLLVEMIRRKPINPKYEAYVNAAGFLLLIGIMIAVTFKDVINLF